MYQENGHVTHFTFAVTDADKNTSAVNDGGSKIIVVPFDGVQFDCDNGDAASCDELTHGTGGTSGAGGSSGGGGRGGAAGEQGGGAGHASTGGSAGATGVAGGGGQLGTGGSGGAAAGQATGGGPSIGGVPGNMSGSAGQGPNGGGVPGMGGGAVSAAPASGCSCEAASKPGGGLGLLLLTATWQIARRRRRLSAPTAR